MKIHKRNPGHLLMLAAFLLQSMLGVLFRGFRSRSRDTCVVVLYGHKLNGNLLELHRYLLANPQYRIHPVFLTMDAHYAEQLASEGVAACLATTTACVRLLSRADAIISDHGLHSLQPFVRLYQKAGLRFFDVWHGIPFKGFDAQDFRVQHRYDEVWVASDLCRQLYVERYGFDPGRVKVTGYPRTDSIVRPEASPAELRARLGLPAEGRLIIFAPTWKQDAAGRSIYPFGCAEDAFLEALASVMQKHGAYALLRSHLNSGDVAEGKTLPPRILPMPGTRYPDTESILQVGDILICDWSSIAFDYLLLNRPTIFLDVPPPFRKGFSLGPEYRFGQIASNLEELLQKLEACLAFPELYWQTQQQQHALVREKVYGSIADGRASGRCVERLVAHLRGPLPPNRKAVPP